MRLDALPYPGLRSFRRDESYLFFGRQSCVDTMVDLLAETRFLAVLGSSGSGKSSLVRTGLLDALSLGYHPWAGSSWEVIDLHPGGQPICNLATALCGRRGGAVDAREIDLLSDFLRRSPRALAEWVAGGNLEPGSNLLILVDQFEELFRYGGYARQEEAEAFVKLLLESASVEGVNLHVVVTMRSEYLGACALMPGLAEKINAGMYLTPRMTRDECREAIEGPARTMKFSVEPALVTRLLNDLSTFAPWESAETLDQTERLARRADQLPLMQHVLNRLWARAAAVAEGSKPVLLLKDYDGLGGLSGAIDEHGKEILDRLSPSLRVHVETIFRSLVTGFSVASAVRRPTRLAEVVAEVGDRDAVLAILPLFTASDCNFIRTSEAAMHDGVIVDISHESLIRQWTALRQWLEAEAQAAAALARLSSAEDRYSKNEGDLLGGIELQHLASWWHSGAANRAWLRRQDVDFDRVDRFVRESEAAQQKEENEERARRQKDRSLLFAGAFGIVVALLAVVIVLRNQVEMGKSRLNESQARLETAMTQKKAEETKDKVNKALDDIKTAIAAKDYPRLQAVIDSPAWLAIQNKNKDTKVHENSFAQGDGRLGQIQLDVTSSKILDVFNSLKDTDKLVASFSTSTLPSKRSEDKVSPVKGAPGLAREDVVAGLVSLKSVEDHAHRGLSLESSGDAKEALLTYEKAYEESRGLLQQYHGKSIPPEPLMASYLGVGQRYAWFLYDIGESQKGDETLHQMVQAVEPLRSEAHSAHLLIAFADLENLRSRVSSDKKQTALAKQQGILAMQYAERAVELAPTDLDAGRAAFTMYRNNYLIAEGAEERAFLEKECSQSELMYQRSPTDVRVVRDRMDCLNDQSFLLVKDKKADEAKKKVDEALQVASASLAASPLDQELLLYKAKLENRQAGLLWGQGKEDEQYKWRMRAKDDLVLALSGRTLFQQQPDEVKNLYTNCCQNFAYPSGQERVTMQEIVNALTPTLDAFPRSPSLNFVGGDAALRLGKLLQVDEQTQLAEVNLNKGIEWFSRSGVINDISEWSEDFDTYCGGYNSLVRLYAQTKQVDLLLANTKKMSEVCSPALQKYPWDFYLRQHFIQNEWLAGSALYELKRFSEALPHLQYASHWGDSESTKDLANMYRNGSGVAKDEKLAKELDELAPKQIQKSFSIPIDVNGTKQMFKVSVRQWPDDYTFEGKRLEGIDDQVMWLKMARGIEVGSDVTSSFRKLDQIARDNNVSFPELTEYALGEAKKIVDDPKATTADGSEDSKKAAVADKVKQAQLLANKDDWPGAFAVAEDGLKIDPRSPELLGIVEGAYQDHLFEFDKAYELNLARVAKGVGFNDYVEKNLTTGRYTDCVRSARIARENTDKQPLKVVMTIFEFACLTGENKKEEASLASKRLRTELQSSKGYGWTFNGTEHYMEQHEPFRKNHAAWKTLLEAFRSGNQAEASASLDRLGVPK